MATALAALSWATGTNAWLPSAIVGRPCCGARVPTTSAAILAAAAAEPPADDATNANYYGGGARLVSCDTLSKSYDGTRYQFRDISLGVSAGARIGLVGVNGVGKSTLMKCLAGLESPDSGTVSFEGRPVSFFVGEEASASARFFMRGKLKFGSFDNRLLGALRKRLEHVLRWLRTQLVPVELRG